MRQIRPTIDELKKRYSRAMAQRKMTERRHAARPSGAKVVKTPDNSEPWMPHPPQSLADCIWISEQASRRVEEWQQAFIPTTSSAS
ncbi:MAG: hypothetical protein ABMA13_17625 [Chthoniobacteraceae bacterium]